MSAVEHRFVLEGISFRTLSAVAQRYGLLRSTLDSRLRRGWPLHKAVGLDGPTKRELAFSNQPVSIAGKEFSTLASAALWYGIPKRRVVDRIEKGGWSLEEAFGLVPRNGLQPWELNAEPAKYLATSRTVSVCGQNFGSLTAACRHFGISKESFFKRLKVLNWSLEQALGLQPPPNGAIRCLGRVYKVTHLATGKAYVGITRSSLAKRWQGHLDKAFGQTDLPPGSLAEAIRDQGADAFSIEQLALAQSESELCSAERQYIARLGTYRPAGFNLTRGGEGVGVRNRPVQAGSVTFRSVTEACDALGASINLVRRAMAKGMTFEDALARAKHGGPNSRPLQYKGVQYSSLRSACKAAGADYKPTHRRMVARGLTGESAISAQLAWQKGDSGILHAQPEAQL